MSMDIADSVKNQGLLGFMRLVDGGPEISLEFKKGEYSKAVKITLDGHEVLAYLTLVPSDGTPNMALALTKMAHTAAFSEQPRAVSQDPSDTAEAQAKRDAELAELERLGAEKKAKADAEKAEAEKKAKADADKKAKVDAEKK